MPGPCSAGVPPAYGIFILMKIKYLIRLLIVVGIVFVCAWGMQYGPRTAKVRPVPIDSDNWLTFFVSGNPEAHKMVVKELKEMGDDGIQLLLDALKDEKPSVRLAALEAIQEINAPTDKVGESVVRTLNDESPRIREEASYILIGLGYKSENAISPLMKMLYDEDSKLREASAAALGTMGPMAYSALPRLKYMADHDHSNAIYIMSTPEDRYKDTSIIARVAAAKIEGADSLIELLQQNNPDVSEGAAYALGEIDVENPDPRVVDALINALKYESENIRLGAEVSLRKLAPNSPTAKEALRHYKRNF
jgi:HEAT repeat protein